MKRLTPRWSRVVAALSVLGVTARPLCADGMALERHAAGGVPLSFTVFCLLGLIAVYLVFKGTRSR